MDLKKLFKFEKEKGNLKRIKKSIVHLWMNYQVIIFILFLLISTAAGIYIWYRSLYRSNWSDEQKKEYASTQIREVNLKEEDFKKAIGEIKRRREIFDIPSQSAKDIFKPF